jgi:hypothetical protein
MTTERNIPILRRRLRSLVSIIYRCPVHGITAPDARCPGKCPHVRCFKELLASKVTRQVLE